MIKRIVIAGCRTYTDYERAAAFFDKCLQNLRNRYELVILSGGCRGADTLGERYAQERHYAVERHPAEWHAHGRAAGPLRNENMAQRADYVICIWDGSSRGTASMIDCARRAGKPLRIMRISQEKATLV